MEEKARTQTGIASFPNLPFAPLDQVGGDGGLAGVGVSGEQQGSVSPGKKASSPSSTQPRPVNDAAASSAWWSLGAPPLGVSLLRLVFEAGSI
jgi:hypothetical protein